MNPVSLLGKILVISGLVLIIVGIAFILGSKIPHLGRLPGDIYIQRKGFTFYFPITTAILISILLSLIFWIFNKLR
jgi:hypothetical protein